MMCCVSKGGILPISRRLNFPPASREKGEGIRKVAMQVVVKVY